MHDSRRRQRILGIIVVLWGGAIVIRGLVFGVAVPGHSAYGNGAFAGWLVGIVMIIVGWRAIAKTRQPTDL